MASYLIGKIFLVLLCFFVLLLALLSICYAHEYTSKTFVVSRIFMVIWPVILNGLLFRIETRYSFLLLKTFYVISFFLSVFIFVQLSLQLSNSNFQFELTILQLILWSFIVLVYFLFSTLILILQCLGDKSCYIFFKSLCRNSEKPKSPVEITEQHVDFCLKKDFPQISTASILSLIQHFSEPYPSSSTFIQFPFPTIPIGLTHCPGRKRGKHSRDLSQDLHTLVSSHGAVHIISLIEDWEAEESEIQSLYPPLPSSPPPTTPPTTTTTTTSSSTLRISRYPIQDKWIPRDMCSWVGFIENEIILPMCTRYLIQLKSNEMKEMNDEEINTLEPIPTGETPPHLLSLPNLPLSSSSSSSIFEKESFIIHCNGGKGRAATTLACLLLSFLGDFLSCSEIIQWIRKSRKGTLKNPLQLLYLYWYSQHWRQYSTILPSNSTSTDYEKTEKMESNLFQYLRFASKQQQEQQFFKYLN